MVTIVSRYLRMGGAWRIPVLALALSGCLSSARPVEPARVEPVASAQRALVPLESGFLSDYAVLMPTGQYPDLRIYRDANAQTSYRKLLFHPVEIWRSADRRLEDIPEEDLQYLADALYRSVESRLRRNFQLVRKPAPGVLEIRMAFTLVTKNPSPVDFFATEVPVEKLPPRSGRLDPNTRKFLRACAMEAEFAETTAASASSIGKPGPPTSKVVRAAVFDRRRGSETSKGAVAKWEDVQSVFERWGALIDQRLLSQSAAANTAPKKNVSARQVSSRKQR
jgi:hypothetical protein